jgi:type IV pilus assembly protein PilX
MKNTPSIQMPHRRQQGFVLIVAMLLLLLMTILGVSASQSGLLNERQAGNVRDRALALESSETLLRRIEDYVLLGYEVTEDFMELVKRRGIGGFSGPNTVRVNATSTAVEQRDIASAQGLSEMTDTKWDNASLTLQAMGLGTYPKVDSDKQPQAVIGTSIAVQGADNDDDNASEQYKVGKLKWYRITSRGRGNQGGEVILETMFVYQTEK